MKCQNKDTKTNFHCEGKGRAMIEGIRVCDYCFYWIKKRNKEKAKKAVF